MKLNQVMKICSGLLLVLLPMVSSGVGYKHGLALKDALLEGKALCMRNCLKIENDQRRMACEESCDDLVLDDYDDDYDNDDYDNDDYDNDDYDNDGYDNDDYDNDDYDNDDYDNYDENTINKKSNNEDKDIDADEYDGVYPEEETLKNVDDIVDPFRDDKVHKENQMKKGNDAPTSLLTCPQGQFYDPDYEECDDCDSICSDADTADLCDSYCPDWDSEDYEDFGSADLGSGNFDDDLETSATDNDARIVKNVTETTEDKESSEMWFETSSDSESSANDTHHKNSTLSGAPPSYSELKSIQDKKPEKTSSALIYSGVFVAGAAVAFVLSVLALTLWKLFRNNIKHFLSAKKETAFQPLPYRSPIVRNGPETFTTERESFL